MSEFIAIAEATGKLGSSGLIVAASIWLLAKYLPGQMRQQGETKEVIRNNSAVIENCTEVLKLVSVKNEELEQSLQRMGEELSRLEEALNRTSMDARSTRLIIERTEQDA